VSSLRLCSTATKFDQYFLSLNQFSAGRAVSESIFSFVLNISPTAAEEKKSQAFVICIAGIVIFSAFSIVGLG